MLTGTLLAESLRIGARLEVPGLELVRLGRRDVSASTSGPTDSSAPGAGSQSGATPGQPSVWTFLEFRAPDERADDLAAALADALATETGWYADFVVGSDHVVVFAHRVFRYRIGDDPARQQAVAWGRAAGTPEHQLDWGP